MQVQRLAIPDVLLLTPKVFEDERGFFYESFNQKVFDEAVGRPVAFVQDNHSKSAKGVLRGLHYQLPPKAQGKLVRVVRGAVFDGQHVAVELSAENWRQLWVPRGFAHGYLTLEPDTEVLYKTDAYYDRAADAGIAWNDPAFGIAWPVETGSVILSDKDRSAPRLADIAPPFPEGSW